MLPKRRFRYPSVRLAVEIVLERGNITLWEDQGAQDRCVGLIGSGHLDHHGGASMPTPDFQSLFLPLLRLTESQGEVALTEAVDMLADTFALTEQERATTLRSGQTRMYNRTAWAATYLRKAGLIASEGRGRYQISESGRDLLASGRLSLDVAYLEANYPGVREFRLGGRNQNAEPRTSGVHDAQGGPEATMEGITGLVPDQASLNAVAEALASGIELADNLRSDGWYLKYRRGALSDLPR